MEKVYIASAKRLAVGSFLGSLKAESAGRLGAEVVKAILEETKIDPNTVDEVIMGNILPAGQGQGVGRQVAVLAGLPQEVCGYSLNMACGSGMKAVMIAYANIKAGLHHCVLAGGTEVMSGSPYLIPKEVRSGHKMGDLTAKDHMIYDALTDAFDKIHMGVTAENIANKYQISRQEQEKFSIESQTKAIASVDAGLFKEEIVPVTVKVGREEVVFDQDEYPNRKTDLEKLSKLKPAFVKDGTVTAGTASGLNDGASCVLVVSESYLKANNLTAIAEVIGIGQGGVDPKVMGLGPTPAVKAALKHAGLTLKDMDLIELNEAFAAQSLGVVHELSEAFDLDKEEIMSKTNVRGGAIALGHPVGASGNRILVSLIHALKQNNKEYGLASLCIGGGMGTAVVLKRV